MIAAIYYISVIILFILSVVKYIKHLRTPRAERKAGPTLFFVVMTIQFVWLVCMFWFVFKIVGAKTKHEYKVADTSDAIYCTNHFNDNCLALSEYTACNRDSIVYVDGLNLYRLSDHQVILKNVQIRKMLYTDYYLYVLDDKDVFYIIDMETMSTYKVQNVNAFYYDNVKIYLSSTYPNISGFYGIDEESIIKNGEVVPFDQMEDVDDVAARKIKARIYDGNGYYYWTNCDRKEVSVCRKRVEETENIKDGIRLDDDYIISDNDLSIDGENAYILYRIHSGHTKYQNTQKETYRDGIISLDFDKEKSKIVYETEDNTSRIIGFDYEKNIVYLYDVNNLSVNVLDLNTNQEETLDALPKKYNTLTFEKSRDNIFIYTYNNELVKIVELNK